MAKSRSTIADYGIYLAVRLLVCLIQTLSFRKACALAKGLAWLAYRVDRRHRAVAGENLRHAFPGRFTDDEYDALVRSVYLHFCTLVVEIVYLPRRLHTNTWRRYLELRDGRQIVTCLLSGRPLLILTMHFGNWEMAGYALGLLGFTTHAVARPLDNPFLDDFLRRFRECTGQKVLAKKGDFEQMQAILDRGGVIATLADQDAGQRGLFVDFFNRPASTHKAIALLALEHRVPLLVTGTPRVTEPMGYQVMAEDLILPEEYDGKPDAVRAMTQRFTSALERLIRLAPQQYFWLHRRWKHQPARRKARAA
ncbi:MAG TPA: lysophospholipid acyltransferase family protein [Gemmataceae bacterium]|jgi:KDO2-lipid IV(A) lauroyltransferase|nr:lysophospholipid acyltransferase family protein [Gemmataceae bacterium]